MTENTNPLVQFKKDMTTLIERKELPLPSNVSVEAFKNAAIVAAQDNPQILLCERDSVFKSIRSLAAAGLVPDGREAALVPFKTRDGDRYISKCQAMPMVFGLIKMVRRSGEVADIRAHIVYSGEVEAGRFEYVIGDEERLEHQPILFGDRGDPVACYAIAKLKDGTIIREFMSAQEIDHIRRSGASQKIFQKGERPKVSETPIGIWADWWGEMWKKTVIRRICKRLDMSAEDMRRVMVEQDFDGMKDVSPPRDTPMSRLVNQARGKTVEQGVDTPATAPESAAEADVVDGQAEIPAEPETSPYEALDVSDAAPGSAAWDRGLAAFDEGKPITTCPYDIGTPEAVDFCGAWRMAQRARE